ncbi:MAG: arginine N-succinyltransferase [Halobacteriovoraceae bacterium]|jgi:arginine N-succinyltransferase|nr:arginine N-succinyltransferase [Halobacteriovoraceae bacterium]
MFVLRSVSLNDLNDLYELSGKVFFINLPHDKKIIETKINNSLKSFKHPSSDFSKNYYIFVIEDTETHKVIGVSMIHAQHGTEKEPHFFLRVANEHKYSQSINTGFVHGTLRLGLDTNGPTEIGGLVLSPEYRGNPNKLGKQISFIRFLYMALNKKQFKKTVLSELMPPLDADGNSPLWEAIGRRFLNMDYEQADRLSRSNKEFILSLFPSDNIYMTLLPLEARNAISKVGRETEPVKKMLESIGFSYVNEVDPFDGGPHFKSSLKDISLIKEFKNLTLELSEQEEFDYDHLVSFQSENHPFLAIKTKAKVENESIYLPQDIIEQFNLKKGQPIASIPF